MTEILRDIIAIFSFVWICLVEDTKDIINEFRPEYYD